MSRYKQLRLGNMSQLLALASLVAKNSQANPYVAAALAEYGYPAERFQELETLSESLRRAYDAYRHEYVSAIVATEKLRTLRREAQRHYVALLTLARLAFREDEAAQQRLQLRGRRAKAFSAWREQVESFYDALSESPALMERLSAYGVDEARLAAGREALARAVAMKREQQDHRARATTLREERWRLQRALYRWLSDFRIVARLAVDEEHAELLEGLGIKVPS